MPPRLVNFIFFAFVEPVFAAKRRVRFENEFRFGGSVERRPVLPIKRRFSVSIERRFFVSIESRVVESVKQRDLVVEYSFLVFVEQCFLVLFG